jgi:hypothetical protein
VALSSILPVFTFCHPFNGLAWPRNNRARLRSFQLVIRHLGQPEHRDS